MMEKTFKDFREQTLHNIVAYLDKKYKNCSVTLDGDFINISGDEEEQNQILEELKEIGLVAR